MQDCAVLFDLDGTLTDSGEGILNCAQLALRHFGLPADDREALRAFVGPPLRESFPRFGVPADRVEEAISVFRGRYLTVGKFENFPYPGIRELLEQLKTNCISMYVATSKPEETAVEILHKFGLEGYFTRICGASLGEGRESKAAVIQYLLEGLPEGQQVLMVGDTIYDVEGAKAFSIPTVGVAWGYGDRQEMEKEGAVAMVESPEALFRYILKHFS